jgi:hypothetical protein
MFLIITATAVGQTINCELLLGVAEPLRSSWVVRQEEPQQKGGQ